MKLLKYTILVGAVCAAVTLQSAKADTFSFDLIASNIEPASAGPFVNVNVNLTSSTTATITFTSLTKGGHIYLLGDGGTVAVNVNASSWTLGTITGSNSGTGFTPGPFSDGGAGNEDGFGSFNQTINSFDGFTHSSDLVSFTLTDTSGTWASAAAVLTGNSDGNLAAAHIFVTTTPANASNGAIVTGFASGVGQPTPPSTPDGGATATLLGLGLAGLAGLRARFGRN
jgi:hypothetical protein